MAEPRPRAAPVPPLVVDGRVDEVRRRISQRALVVRSTWFPTPRELRAWEASGVPAYVRWLRHDVIEVGPRLESMWASCFSPVLRGPLQAEGARTRVAWRRAWPGFTVGLLGLWVTVLLVWFVAIAWQISEGYVDAGAVFWWCFLAAATASAPLLGWRYGGPELDEAEAWVRQMASLAAEEDW